MDERKQKILNAIIQDYISSAEPVGSRTIARKYELGVSPATIRNEMFDLEMLGYLEQPHTSAGRIPSLKGYRFYVDCLLEPKKISDQERQFVESWYDTKAKTVEEVFRSTAKVLSAITHNVALVLSTQKMAAKFKYMRFLPLDEERSILIVVTDDGQIENSIFVRPMGVTNEDLNMIGEKMNHFLAGVPLHEVNMNRIHTFYKDIVEDSDLYRLAFHSLLGSFKQKQRLYKGGATEIFANPEFKDVERARDLLFMLEENDKVADMMQSNASQDLVIKIGEENELSAMKDCSVVQATFKSDGRVLGTLAVVGPTRMEYAKIIGLLEFMQQHITRLLTHYEGKG